MADSGPSGPVGTHQIHPDAFAMDSRSGVLVDDLAESSFWVMHAVQSTGLLLTLKLLAESLSCRCLCSSIMNCMLFFRESVFI